MNDAELFEEMHVVYRLGLGVVFSLWWIYFVDLNGSAIRTAVGTGHIADYQQWPYAHLPLVIGLATVEILAGQ